MREQDGLIETRRMTAAGRKRVRRRAEAGELEQITRGVYCQRIAWERAKPAQKLKMRIAAESRRRPAAIVVGLSAAFLHELPRPTGMPLPEVVELGSFSGANANREHGVHMKHVGAWMKGHQQSLTTAYGDVAVSSPLAVCVQLLTWSDMTTSVVAIEGALQKKVLPILQLPDLERQILELPSARRVREGLGLISPYSESPRESEVKLRLYLEGFPVPYQQVSIFTGNGVLLGRVDFMFECGLILEYDGESKYYVEDQWWLDTVNAQALWNERMREKSIQNEGFEFFRVTKGTFRDGSWLLLLRRRLEELEELGKKAPQGRWSARGRAWGNLAERMGRAWDGE